jgi:hypothetical protein
MANYTAKLRSLATVNLAILAIRLIQFFFAGMVMGLMAFFIQQEIKAGQDASSPYCFVLVVAVVTIITHFIYCFSFYHKLTFLWDLALATGWLISFFWVLNFVQPLPCSWSAFNPFGEDHCSQQRAVLVIQIVISVLWYITGAIGLTSLIRINRKGSDIV